MFEFYDLQSRAHAYGCMCTYVSALIYTLTVDQSVHVYIHVYVAGLNLSTDTYNNYIIISSCMQGVTLKSGTRIACVRVCACVCVRACTCVCVCTSK